MRVLDDEDPKGDPAGSVVTIGVFDGVHRGHQRVLSRVVADARSAGLAASVVTFHPHPARVLAPERAPRQLESLERRLARFAELGVDQVRVITFDERASLESPDDFVARVLVGDLAARRVVVGEDFRFGHDRAGTVLSLAAAGTAHGFAVEAIEDVGDGTRFSSTSAREAVEAGDLVRAEAILGHHVVVSGEVIHGDGRGGEGLGFPTANLALPADVVRPGLGIYAGAAMLGDEAHLAAISIGRRPQYYEHGEVLVEAHLVDYRGDLYGDWIDLVLLKYLRPELRFESEGALRDQIEADVAATRFFGPEIRATGPGLLGLTPGQRR